MKDHHIRVPILGVSREVAIYRCIRVVFTITTNRHDLRARLPGHANRFTVLP